MTKSSALFPLEICKVAIKSSTSYFYTFNHYINTIFSFSIKIQNTLEMLKSIENNRNNWKIRSNTKCNVTRANGIRSSIYSYIYLKHITTLTPNQYFPTVAFFYGTLFFLTSPSSSFFHHSVRLFKQFLANVSKSLFTLLASSFNGLVHCLHNFLCSNGLMPRSHLNLLLPQLL